MKVNDEQIESMKNFIFDVMEDWQEGGGIEGYDLQEIAEKHGILIPHTVYAPCGDYCNCVECYNDDEFRGGVPCYTFPDWLTRVAEQRDGAESGDGANWICKSCSHENYYLRGKCWFCDASAPS